MGVGEVVGGLAAAGVVVMIGLALADSPDDQQLTSDTVSVLASGDVAASTTTTSAATTLSVTVTVPDTTTEATSAPTSAEPAVTSEATTSTTGAPTTEATPPTTLPVEARGAVRVQVLNAGVAAGSANDNTDILRFAGFDPVPPRDAEQQVAQPTVLFRAGQDAAARTVAGFLQVPDDHVIPAPTDDPNWQAFGADLDVLVLLGPTR